MEIRQENPNDYEDVYKVVKEAFANAAFSDGDEQDLVVRLRQSGSFVPELSLVAVENKKIVGHILFTRAFVGSVAVLALAPLSVLPQYQKKGIGLSLIKQGHDAASRLGYEYSVVLGHAEYYPRAGYVPADRYGIQAPFEVENENFMAICLKGTGENLNGVIRYDGAFGLNNS